MTDNALDPASQAMFDIKDKHGIASLGLHSNKQWYEDPKHLLFSMARYKFVAKMLSGTQHVAELGCGDGFNSRIVKQEVETLSLYDINAEFVSNAVSNMKEPWSCEVAVHDITQGPLARRYDACYSLDVLEHIDQSLEKRAIQNFCDSITDTGVLILGMPSLESQKYSPPAEISGHINCKSGNDFRALMQQYFHNVFLFSMNDEVVHTGFVKMAHYLFCLCVNKR